MNNPATATATQTPGQATIRIQPNGTLAVSPDPLSLSKSQGHRATWRLEGGNGQFEIHFKQETPFHARDFTQDTAKAVSPRPDVNGDPQKTYKYTVKVAGSPDLDPQVIVDQ